MMMMMTMIDDVDLTVRLGR